MDRPSPEQSHSSPSPPEAASARAGATLDAVVFVFIPLGVLIYLVYLSTAAPGAWWGDGLELAAAAYSLGVPHPTGYPLYMLLGHGFIRLFPTLDPGRATTLFSALLCSGSAVLAGWAIYRRLTLESSGGGDEKARGGHRPGEAGRYLARAGRLCPCGAGRRRARITLAAAGTAFLLAFTRTLWEHATFTEVYPLTLFLTTGILAVAAGIEPERATAGRVAALGALCGLAALNHYSATAVAPLAAFKLIQWGWRRRRLGRFILVFLLAFLPFLAGYLYLPLRASVNPPINWGDPRTLERFLWVLTGGDYVAFNAPQGGLGAAFAGGLEFWIGWWGRQILPDTLYAWRAGIGLIVLAGGLLGCLMTARTDRALGWGMIALLGMTAMFAVFYRIPDLDAYFLPALPAAALGWIVLAREGLRRWRRRAAGLYREGVVAALPLLLGVLLMSALYPRVDKSWDDGPGRWARAVFEAAPADALILTRQAADSEIYALWYEQIVNKTRPDVTVFGTGFIFSGWYRRYFEAGGRPRLPLFVTEREAGSKAIYDIALAGGVIVPNYRERPVLAVAADRRPDAIDPLYRKYMNPEPVAELLPAAYYRKTSYRLNPPGRWLIELHPEPGFARLARERFAETFGEMKNEK